MKCESCQREKDAMRLTFRLGEIMSPLLRPLREDRVRYRCVTPGITATLWLPRSLDEPARELTVFVEGAG